MDLSKVRQAARLLPGPLLLALTVIILRKALFTGEEIFLSSQECDIFHQFMQWREFGFSELRRGNIALWNPYLFSGAPYFGTFQAALLYPLNLIFLFLPLHLAVNWSLALHIFLIGYLTYKWLCYRGMSQVSSFSGAVICMFSGPIFFRVFAGHISHLSTMAWGPLLFMAVDGTDREPGVKWALAGMAAVAMMALGGHPQYLFCTAIVGLLYFSLCLIKSKNRPKKIFLFASILAGGILLSAVQIFTSLSESAEGIKSGGAAYGFASSFSLPPESAVTLLAPGFFGDYANAPHWGRSLAWESSFFMGVAGFLLAVCGLFLGKPAHKRFAGWAVLAGFLLALGGYSPIFPFLYRWVFGFNMFRGHARFLFPAALFFSVLAGAGFESILKRGNLKLPSFIAGITAIILFLTAVSLQSSIELGSDSWHKFMLYLQQSGETYADFVFVSKDRMNVAGMFAVRSLKISALVSFSFWAIILLTKKKLFFAYATVLLVMIEMFAFSKSVRQVFTADNYRSQNRKIAEFLENNPGDYRIHNVSVPNRALVIPAYEIWGYEGASFTRRFAEFMNFASGDEDPFRKADDAMLMHHSIPDYNNLYRILRLRYMFRGGRMIRDFGEDIPRIYTVSKWEIIEDKESILPTLMSEDFDVARKVILESEPFGGQISGSEISGGGEFRITDVTTGRVVVEGYAEDYSILVVTDNYSSHWRTEPLEGTSQDEYKIMPANHTVRGIPLSPGYHHFKKKYKPAGFIIGKWVSGASSLLYIFGLVRLRKKNGKTDRLTIGAVGLQAYTYQILENKVANRCQSEFEL